VAKPGEFRSNLHRGGKGDAVALAKRFASVAIRASKAMGLEVAGVDMLEARTGPKILEINSSPGLEGIERASGINVASAIVQHAERYATVHRRISKRALDQRIHEVIQDERRITVRPGPRAGKPAS
jgi:ribosomal protein S6--L-glutamate ligase